MIHKDTPADTIRVMAAATKSTRGIPRDGPAPCRTLPQDAYPAPATLENREGPVAGLVSRLAL